MCCEGLLVRSFGVSCERELQIQPPAGTLNMSRERQVKLSSNGPCALTLLQCLTRVVVSRRLLAVKLAPEADEYWQSKRSTAENELHFPSKRFWIDIWRIRGSQQAGELLTLN